MAIPSRNIGAFPGTFVSLVESLGVDGSGCLSEKQSNPWTQLDGCCLVPSCHIILVHLGTYTRHG